MRILQGVNKSVLDRIKGKVSDLQTRENQATTRAELEKRFDPNSIEGLSPEMQHYMDEQFDFELEEKYIDDKAGKSK